METQILLIIITLLSAISTVILLVLFQTLYKYLQANKNIEQNVARFLNDSTELKETVRQVLLFKLKQRKIHNQKMLDEAKLKRLKIEEWHFLRTAQEKESQVEHADKKIKSIEKIKAGIEEEMKLLIENKYDKYKVS